MRVFNLIICLVAFNLMTSGNSARADWQYTKWGMTLDEVIKASNGAAHAPFINGYVVPGQTADHHVGLAATYKTGRFLFVAFFFFDNNNHLVEVRLCDGMGITYSDLLETLQEIYGFGQNGHYWVDKENNTTIGLFSIESMTTIIYSPLHPSQHKGL